MTALLARLERDYARAIRFEERAPTVQAAWSRAAASESALRKLRLVQAGLPLPAPREPRTQRNLVRGAFAALASLGRVIARSAQAAAALAKAQVVNAARRAARAVHRSLRSALESIVNIIIGGNMKKGNGIVIGNRRVYADGSTVRNYPTLTRAQAQATAEGATRFSMVGSSVIAHRPSKSRPGEEATCALVQNTDGTWRFEGWVA